MATSQSEKKMKILCLHGFRTSGSFLQKQISKWDPSIFSQFDLDFPDGKYPAGGKSEIEGIFPPPYFEWFQFDNDFTAYTHLEECISYLCEYITTRGPFDGFLGFSQGATLSALLLGYQAQGKTPSKVKSVHFIGAKDWLKEPSEDLATAFDSPLIIRHPQGHTVPRLDEAATQQLRAWATEIFSYNSRILNGENHESEKGEDKVDDEEEAKPEEVPNKIDVTQVQQDGIGIEVNREVEAVNA
ncbi:hypothetical protein OIU84_011712 [Salix udensis]|uniref:Serine hydrolase domain-containing protein n=1 Tax=Salix udensis TaxID=889485 RepID=A0AAD6JQM0_9ROSI|nr:hypothetical protein OIU84_011712 [Salix udensis]